MLQLVSLINYYYYYYYYKYLVFLDIVKIGIQAPVICFISVKIYILY